MIATASQTSASHTITVNGQPASQLTLRQSFAQILTQTFEQEGLSADTSIANNLVANIPSLEAVTLTNGDSLLDSTIADIAVNGDPAAADAQGSLINVSSLRNLLYDALFQNATPTTLSTIFNQVLNGNAADTFSNGSPLGSATLGSIMTTLLGGTSLSSAIGTQLKATFQNYVENSKGWVTPVSGATYDMDGRLVGETEQKSWTSVGGGNIPGLDSGWVNSTALVTDQFAYNDTTGLLSQEVVSATVNGTNASLPNTITSINYKYLEGDITYDSVGHQTGNTSLIVQPLSYTYYYYSLQGVFNKVNDTPQSAVLAQVATLTTSQNLGFNAQGQVTSDASAFVRDDRNLTSGSNSETNITYDANGFKVSSTSSGQNTIDEWNLPGDGITATKKNPSSKSNRIVNRFIGKPGKSHKNRTIATEPIINHFMEMSRSVLGIWTFFEA